MKALMDRILYIIQTNPNGKISLRNLKYHLAHIKGAFLNEVLYAMKMQGVITIDKNYEIQMSNR